MKADFMRACIYFLVIAVLSCVILVSFFLLNLTGYVVPLYDDTNGPYDFSLQTLTEQDIFHGTDGRIIMSATVTHNNVTTCTAQTFCGVKDLFEISLNNETRKIILSSKITKGNARLVLVVNDEIVHEFALNKDKQHFTLKNITGVVYLKLAGESARYSVTYQLQ